ncbi:peptidoglycan-recognition protein LB-like [Macrosteles quadrilineatus]|uniref:peptidoglycan-recognition protein LB-like n=1 Tax=Macrosteles quadrilineatus TaxID=74068 RepID=UPI0023E16ECC|nr:peptidoglycan-recognition protein LB-like [Macrosteles quadrilineatus]
MSNPVDTVVIHHTHIPAKCHTLGKCKEALRYIQNFHMDDRGWDDIGYSFAIGMDRVFEGRGWSRVGAHAPPYNSRSIGIVFIGDYTDELPSEDMLCQCRQLINYGVSQGYIRPDYQLIGHRQARFTECPGENLYNLIQTWNHWKPLPVVTS